MEDFSPQTIKDPKPPQSTDHSTDNPEPSIQPNPASSLLSDIPQTSPQAGFSLKTFLSENRWYIAGICLGLAIIGGLAAFAFWPQQEERTEAAKVQLSIDSTEVAQAGGELVYKVKVLNQDPAKLVDMNLELVYDDGVSYVSSSPKAENISGSSFLVPDLATGQNAVVIVKTNLQGNVNDTKRMVARLHYRFDNFNSPFSVEADHTTKLVAADVVMNFSGPEQANNNEDIKYDLFYRNSSSKDIDNARLQITYPERFKFKSSEPQASLSLNIWNIGTLKANQSGKITILGSFSGANVGQSFNFKGDLLALDDNGDYFTQSSSFYTTSISNQPLSVEARLATGKSPIVEPGNSLNIDLTFKNNTQIANTGLQVVAEIEFGGVVQNSIEAEGGFIQDKTITWNGSSNSKLERLNPGESGSVKLKFQLTNPLTESNQKNLLVKIKPRIKSNQNVQFIEGAKLELKTTSPSSLNGFVTSTSGSLPPQVGTQSTFKIRLALSNSTNDYRDGLLVAYIPIGLEFDATSINTPERNLIKYDKTTGRLSWTVGKLDAHAGDGLPERVLEFLIRATPTSAQLGSEILLLKTIVFSATDDFTTEPISIELDDLSTKDLPGGSQQGEVVQ